MTRGFISIINGASNSGFSDAQNEHSWFIAILTFNFQFLNLHHADPSQIWIQLKKPDIILLLSRWYRYLVSMWWCFKTGYYDIITNANIIEQQVCYTKQKKRKEMIHHPKGRKGSTLSVQPCDNVHGTSLRYTDPLWILNDEKLTAGFDTLLLLFLFYSVVRQSRFDGIFSKHWNRRRERILSAFQSLNLYLNALEYSGQSTAMFWCLHKRTLFSLLT